MKQINKHNKIIYVWYLLQRNLTTAIVHPIQSYNSCIGHSMYYSDSNSIEKHPEEDISIVETLDSKEDRPDNIRSIVCANPRKKLYFNPDYFELELLMVKKYIVKIN